MGVVEGRPILLTLTLLQQQQSRNGSSFTALGGTGERGPAQEAAAQPELVVLKNSKELRRSEEQFRRIAAPLKRSLTYNC